VNLLVDEDWELSLSLLQTIDTPASLINLNQQFSSLFLAILVSANDSKPTWRFGGKLWTACYFLNDYHLISSYDLKCNFPRLINIGKLASDNYFLFYEPPKWFANVNIKIWENSNMALYADNVQPTFTAIAANVGSVTVSSNTTAVSILAANTNRKGYAIRNRGTKTVLIGFSSTLNTNTAFLSLATGAVYESEKLYLGELFALMTANNSTTDLTITEFV
jgi:hypothetical protein